MQLTSVNSRTRTLDLSSLGSERFTTFSHPAFPGRSARIKKSKFCDGSVKCVTLTYIVLYCTDLSSSAYTGYIDVNMKHFFFYFFESRNDPLKDGVVLWTNGGCCVLLRRKEVGAESFLCQVREGHLLWVFSLN